MRATKRLVYHPDGTKEWVDLDATREGSVRGPKYGEGSDWFKGAKPSDLKNLDDRQLYMSANRLYMSLEERRGSASEQNNAAEAYSAVIKEARSRRELQRQVRREG